jgi:8-oxo-dGTP diphosphatase
MGAQIERAEPGVALAVSVAVERDGKYLLVLRANPPARHMYAFPGGRVEPDEALEDAALRELEEETGLRASNPRPFARFDLTSESSGSSGFLLTVFLADDPGGEARALDDAQAVGWFTACEIKDLPVPQSMVDCMEMLAAGQSPLQPG